MKGVSPLIASVFLIVIVVSVASVITTWLTTLVRETQESVGEKASESIECSNADITIDDVFVSTGSANAIIRNSGFVDNLTITTSQIFNKMGANFSAVNVPVYNFDKGDIETITFSDPGITCSSFSKIIVSTSCGTLSKEFSGAPTCI